MLPVLGGFLVALPILWRPAETPGGETAAGVVYLFTVWALLIVAALVLARKLTPALEDEAAPQDGTPGAERR